MQEAYDRIRELEKAGAEHLRVGKKLSDFRDDEILGYAAHEIVELAMDPEDMTEMADAFSCLIHYCVRKGWHLFEIEAVLLDKLKMRISDPDKT